MRTIERDAMMSLSAQLARVMPGTDPKWHELHEYALLVLATETPIDRAIAYLKDTGSPESATGRLLLRAAERALRESGDTQED